MITKDQLFVGARLRNHYPSNRNWYDVIIVIELTEKGFKYTNAARKDLGPRLGFTDGGEIYESAFTYLSFDGEGQKPQE